MQRGISFFARSDLPTGRTIQLQNRKTTLKQYSIASVVFTKQIALLVKHFSIKIGLFTLHNCCGSCSLEYLNSYLEPESRHPIPEYVSIQLSICNLVITHNFICKLIRSNFKFTCFITQQNRTNINRTKNVSALCINKIYLLIILTYYNYYIIFIYVDYIYILLTYIGYTV